MSDVTDDMLSTSPIYKAMPPISRMIWDDKYLYICAELE